MKYISLVIQVIGDLRDIKGAYSEYKTASAKAKELKDKAHADGYTDFNYIVEQHLIDYN